MKQTKGLWNRLAGTYWGWRLYHFLVADAIAVQGPTKYKLVREFLGDSLGTTVDAGCGPGVFTRYLSDRSTYLVAADIDNDSLERVRARHRNARNVGFIAANAEHLPITDESLDTVLFLEVLEHLTDDTAAIRGICRALRANGRLILSVPVPPGEINEGSAWGHKREGYELPDITTLLEKNGFKVVKHAFAEFKFSRRAARLIRWWRRSTKLPAPIFLSWLAYCDHFLDSNKVETGKHLPGTLIVSARKCDPKAVVRT